MKKKEAIERSQHWWYCDNIINHPGMVGLLHMNFPQVFILMRDYDVAYWADFDTWAKDIVEINFFNSNDRDTADVQTLLIDAWNFLILTEEEEERLSYLREEDEEFI
jgi:hypothetical protein